VGVNHPFIVRPPTSKAYRIALLLHDYCAIYALPPTPLHVYAVYHAILVMAISCKTQSALQLTGRICIYECVYTFIFIFVCIDIDRYGYACICIYYIFVCVCVCVCLYMYLCISVAACRSGDSRRLPCAARVHPTALTLAHAQTIFYVHTSVHNPPFATSVHSYTHTAFTPLFERVPYLRAHSHENLPSHLPAHLPSHLYAHLHSHEIHGSNPPPPVTPVFTPVFTGV